MTRTPSRTLLSTKHLGVVCAVSGDALLDQDEWNDFLTDLRRVEGAEVRVVFRCGQGSPDPQKLRSLIEITEDRPVHFAIMTECAAAVSNWTAAKWVGGIEIRTFGADHFEAAFDYLDVADAFYPGLERKILSMAEQLEAEAADEGASGVRSKKDGQDASPNAELHLADDLAWK